VRGQLLSKQKPTEAKFIAVKIKEETKVAPQADFLVIENGNGIKINLPLGISEAKIFHLLKIIGWHHA
jgi:hypothetical protein